MSSFHHEVKKNAQGRLLWFLAVAAVWPLVSEFIQPIMKRWRHRFLRPLSRYTSYLYLSMTIVGWTLWIMSWIRKDGSG